MPSTHRGTKLPSVCNVLSNQHSGKDGALVVAPVAAQALQQRLPVYIVCVCMYVYYVCMLWCVYVCVCVCMCVFVCVSVMHGSVRYTEVYKNWHRNYAAAAQALQQ